MNRTYLPLKAFFQCFLSVLGLAAMGHSAYAAPIGSTAAVDAFPIFGVTVTFFVAFVLGFATGFILFNKHAQLRATPSPASSANEESSKMAQLTQQLQAAQQQLISQEKMASMGLLSAGIAHEIKNPLNFINNFSDVTVELLDELKKELAKLNNVPAEVNDNIISIIEDVSTNNKKISEHGKRAESIIKNMLIQAHSAGVEKGAVDINALLEEYLNLAYHGMRAQNNKLNAKIEKKLTPNLPHITASTQSLGRVFLNIINNGLYAANEKAAQIGQGFMPTISISSQEETNTIIIKIRDNGNGIPEHLQKKIFEPFFTTKPVGKGTGLGLPLCNDIIKEHNGTLGINTKPGEFTEFIITLPKDNQQK